MHVYSKVLNMHAFKISSLSLTISPIQYAYGSIAHTLHGLQICTVPHHQVSYSSGYNIIGTILNIK